MGGGGGFPKMISSYCYKVIPSFRNEVYDDYQIEEFSTQRRSSTMTVGVGQCEKRKSFSGPRVPSSRKKNTIKELTDIVNTPRREEAAKQGRANGKYRNICYIFKNDFKPCDGLDGCC